MLDPKQVEQAVIRSKEQATAHGVSQENVDAVAAVMASIELLNSVNDSYAVKTERSIGFPETFAEWARHYKLQSHYDHFLAAAVYLYEQEGISVVNSESIMQMYQKARWDKPKNSADVFAKSAQRVWFVEAEGEHDSGSKMWRITRTGYDYFQTLRQEDDQ